MIYLEESRFPLDKVIDYDVLPTEIGLIEEGMALQLVWQNGQAYVARTVGNGTEQFVGVAFGPRRPLSSYGVIQSQYEISFAGATTNFTDVHNVPIVGGVQTVSVWYVSATGAITYFTPTASPTTAPTATNQVQIASVSPVSLIFYAPSAGAGNDGQTVNIQFNYIPTINDVEFGRGATGYAYNSEQMDFVAKVSVILGSYRIYTDKFVATEDWISAPGNLRALAGGYFGTSTGTSPGTDISGIGVRPGAGYARLIAGPTSFDYGKVGIGISINQ